MVATLLRKFNDFKGKQRLSRLIFRSRITNTIDLVIKGKFDCIYKVPNLKEVIGLELFINGVFEENHIELIISKLPKNGVLLDLGANIGSISIPICKLRPDISALCVEASSVMTKYLKWNIEANKLQNCKVEQKAIWSKSDEKFTFMIPVEQYGKGMISLDNLSSNYENVLSVSIDDLYKQYGFEKVDFIKVDIEGFEYFAFRGGASLLKSPQAPDILFEFIAGAESAVKGLESSDAQCILLSYGYHLYKLHKGAMIKLNKPMDSDYSMIFATKKKL